MTADVIKANLKEAGVLKAIILEHCFAAGTPILTPGGEKFIEDFEIGDEILTRPEDSPDAPLRASTVEKVFRLSGPTLELRVGGRTVTTTEKHPFYVLGKGWTWAAELRRGDMLLGDSGPGTAVESIALTGRHESLYNLRVAFDRTYFVGSRGWGFSLWVHNSYSVVSSATAGKFAIINDVTKEVVVNNIASKGVAKRVAESATFAVEHGLANTGKITVTVRAIQEGVKSGRAANDLHRLLATSRELSSLGVDVVVEGEAVVGGGELVLTSSEIGQSVLVESKRLDNATYRAVEGAIRKGTENGAPVVIDGMGAGLTEATFERGLQNFLQDAVKNRLRDGLPGATGEIIVIIEGKLKVVRY